jgi:ankyrin repeat protein
MVDMGITFSEAEEAPPLWGAAYTGDLEAVMSLLYTEGVDVNAVATHLRCTALHVSAAKGYVDIVLAILTVHQSSVDVQDRTGLTPLQYAASCLKTDVVSLLLRHGASANRQIGTRQRSDPVLLATWTGCRGGGGGAIGDVDESLRLVQILFDHGATVSQEGWFDSIKTMWHIALEDFSDTRLLQLLLQRVTSSTPVPRGGTTIAHQVADLSQRRCEDGIDIDMFKLLVEYGYNIGELNRHGMTPLHVAALRGKVRTVEYLVSAPGVDMDTNARHLLALSPVLPRGVWDVINHAYRKHRAEAFLMSHHPRLGEGSALRALDAEMMQMVLDRIHDDILYPDI